MSPEGFVRIGRNKSPIGRGSTEHYENGAITLKNDAIKLKTEQSKKAYKRKKRSLTIISAIIHCPMQ